MNQRITNTSIVVFSILTTLRSSRIKFLVIRDKVIERQLKILNFQSRYSGHFLVTLPVLTCVGMLRVSSYRIPWIKYFTNKIEKMFIYFSVVLLPNYYR